MIWPPSYTRMEALWRRVITRPLCWVRRHLFVPWDAGGTVCLRCWRGFPDAEQGEWAGWIRERRRLAAVNKIESAIHEERRARLNREAFFCHSAELAQRRLA